MRTTENIKTPRIDFRVTREQHEKMKLQALARRCAVSDVARDAVLRALDGESSELQGSHSRLTLMESSIAQILRILQQGQSVQEDLMLLCAAAVGSSAYLRVGANTGAGIADALIGNHVNVALASAANVLAVQAAGRRQRAEPMPAGAVVSSNTPRA